MKKVSKYILLIIVFLPLLYFRDFTPNNELKYLSIADEALRSGTYLTFTHEGSIYTDKPPLYLWLIMLCKQLLGHHSMLLLGLFSFIPALLILYVMEKWLSPYIPSNYFIYLQFNAYNYGIIRRLRYCASNGYADVSFYPPCPVYFLSHVYRSSR